MIRIVREQTKAPSMTVDNNIGQSHFRLMDCHFSACIPTQTKTPSRDWINKLQSHFVRLYFFTLVWSVGATCDNKGRQISSSMRSSGSW